MVWIPAPQVVVDKMLDMAGVTKRDYVIDLGSGDGRTVIAAARRGARALGIEYNPDMVEFSKRNAEKAGVAGTARFVKADLFQSDYSRASVITLYLLPHLNKKLRPKLLALKPGTRIVSYNFDMDSWQADQTAHATGGFGCESVRCTVLLWVVPAQVAGSYDLPQGRLVLKQEFQMLTGTLHTGGQSYELDGKVRGREVVFSAGGRQYRGQMVGKELKLTPAS